MDMDELIKQQRQRVKKHSMTFIHYNFPSSYKSITQKIEIINAKG